MDTQAKMAADLFKRLNSEELKESPIDTESSLDDILDEAVKVEKQSKKKSKKAKENIKENNDTKTIDINNLPPCKFARLAIKEQVNIKFKEHEIHYKEQNWPIPERTVVYNINLITSRLAAKRISERIYGGGAIENGEAFTGNVRYYEVVTYENVNNDIRTLAFIQVVNNNNKPAFRILWSTEGIKKYKVDKELANKRLMNKLKKMIIKNTSEESNKQ